jgi:hypothetical protein
MDAHPPPEVLIPAVKPEEEPDAVAQEVRPSNEAMLVLHRL